jgi:integrase
MPTYSRKITDTEARKLPLPDAGYVLYTCPLQPGFGVRVSAKIAGRLDGDRAWFFERRIEGKTTRRTLGKVQGGGAISREAALRKSTEIASELHRGEDRVAQRREAAKVEKREAITFGDALREYIRKKRRAKDGLPLKERTASDYLAMLEAPKVLDNGRKTQGGALHAIADVSIERVTPDEIRRIYRELGKRSERQAAYAMQVTRAVLRWHGVVIAGDPFSPSVAGRNRITIAPTQATGRPIPAEKIGSWWNALQGLSNEEGRDYLAFLLLTGCRPSEPLGARVGDFDAEGGRLLLRDTKNRRDHVVMLSNQARAILERNAKGKQSTHHVFTLTDAKRTLENVAKRAGLRIRPKDLRTTFASIAGSLDGVSAFTLRAMLNHMDADVAATHYVRISEAQLRAAWQQVADKIEELARPPTPTKAPTRSKGSNVVALRRKAA